jgi:phosphate transport system permease protein
LYHNEKTRNVQKFLERIAEGFLKLSGGVSSLIILLIIVFLFKEAGGLFSSSEVEEGYVLAVNASNPVKSLSSYEVKEIFDYEIDSWRQVGGEDLAVEVFRIDDIGSFYSDEELGEDYSLVPQRLSELVESHPGMIAFFSKRYLAENFAGKILPDKHIRWADVFAGKEWYPTSTPTAQFGLMPLLLGTLWVSIAAVLLALPLGIAVAIYMAEIAEAKTRALLKPLIELLAGIPSVVYGFFGLVVIVPLIQKAFDLPVGETALAGSIVLAIMALPTIITVSEDALRTTPRTMKEASLALGASHAQTIFRVIIPYAKSGIISAAVLGIGRAIGETMAVLMVTGNAALIPHTLLKPVRTIPATIAAELGEAPAGSPHYQALFLLGCILFIITLIISILVEKFSMQKHR